MRAKEFILEFAPTAGNDRDNEPEYEIIRKLAAQWWHGNEEPRAEKALAALGWTIGQIESGDENDACFVIRPNDLNGDSYIGFTRDDLQLDEQLYFKGSPCTVDCSGHRAGYEWWLRKRRTPYSWSNSFNNGAAIAASGK